ncbi:MAG: glycosyltransferase [bacterium]
MTSLNTHHHYSVLIAPLDWGLGHATRCIPLITYLLENNCHVCVAGEGQQIELIKKEFPQLKFIPLRGYRIHYPKKGTFFLTKLISQLPGIINSIVREHKWLRRNLQKYKWDLVISDNRYGLYTPDITSIFITHQPRIMTGLGKRMDGIAARILKHRIEQFEQCWIPDEMGASGIAGKLVNSKSLPRNCKFIGPLSRLKKSQEPTNENILVLLSGPEPQRSILEELLIKQLKGCAEKILFVRGLPLSKNSLESIQNINFKNHLDNNELSRCMSTAKMVICRSGYSTIMDLLKLNKKALLIPTPGQTEQIYLAERLSKIGWFTTQQQEELNVNEGISNTLNLSISLPMLDFEGYKQAFRELGIQ